MCMLKEISNVLASVFYGMESAGQQECTISLNLKGSEKPTSKPRKNEATILTWTSTKPETHPSGPWPGSCSANRGLKTER